MTEKKTIEFDPADQYELMIAVLDLLSSVSWSVHERCAKAYDKGEYTNMPGVDPRSLVELRRTASGLLRDGVVDDMIKQADANRREHRGQTHRLGA
jgi:hypothetical protein